MSINQQDLNELTDYWHRTTTPLNDRIDEVVKSAQDDAYARGYRRGREDLIEIRQQRDRLLEAVKEGVQEMDRVLIVTSDDNKAVRDCQKRCRALIKEIEGEG